MRHRDYVAERETRDPDFRNACEELRPQFEFRRALIGARIALSLTQKQLADKMGTTQSAIARLESGTQMPTLDTLYRLAVVLGVDFTITPVEPLTARPHKAAKAPVSCSIELGQQPSRRAIICPVEIRDESEIV